MASADLHELSGAFALDALEGDELTLFEAHLAECPECTREVDSFRAAAAWLGSAVETNPPVHLAAAVLARAATRHQMRPSGADSVAGGPALGLGRDTADDIDVILADEDVPGAVNEDVPGAVLSADDEPVVPVDVLAATVDGPVVPDAVVVPLGGAAVRRRKPRWMRARWIGIPAAVAAAALAVVSIRLVQVNHRLDHYQDIAEVAAAPNARSVDLRGPAGQARVVLDPSRNRVLVLSDRLASVSDTQTYQLWLLGPNGPSPAGLFRPDESATVQQLFGLDVPGDTTGMGVTIEPRRGSPKPTTEVILSGTYKT